MKEKLFTQTTLEPLDYAFSPALAIEIPPDEVAPPEERDGFEFLRLADRVEYDPAKHLDKMEVTRTWRRIRAGAFDKNIYAIAKKF
jgi:hypothetical protein